MEYTKLLLSNTTNDEEKYMAAENIIINYDLSLNTNQILTAFKKVLYWINRHGSSHESYKNNRLFLFGKVLNCNKNMYIAIILALCNNFDPANLQHFIIYKEDATFDIGLNMNWYALAINNYKELLDCYEFDVSKMPNIPEEYKQKIEAYRVAKYSGKLTKCAIKK